MKAVPTMFYLVSRAMARAIKEGRKCDRGTMYGVFGTAEKAQNYRQQRGLRMVAVVVEK